MIPNIPLLTQDASMGILPTRTYKINFREDLDRVRETLFSTDADGNLRIVSSDNLSNFSVEDDVLTITYNAVISGHSLTTDDNGTLSLEVAVDMSDLDRVSGFIDDIEAVIQAIYLILNTERYKFVIYSWDYGVELVDLFGKQIPYVIVELPDRITDALMMDDRIEGVTNFEFESKGNKLATTFTVITNVGNINAALEVTI